MQQKTEQRPSYNPHWFILGDKLDILPLVFDFDDIDWRFVVGRRQSCTMYPDIFDNGLKLVIYKQQAKSYISKG